MGGCVYFGCVNDVCRVRDSLIEHNYCHDTLGIQDGYRPGFQLKVIKIKQFVLVY